MIDLYPLMRPGLKALCLLVCAFVLCGASSAAPVKETRTLIADLSVRTSKPRYPFNEIGSIQLSSDGKHLAFAAQVLYANIGFVFGDHVEWMPPPLPTWRWVIDGKEHKEFASLRTQQPVFSPDGRRTAYGAQLLGARGTKALDKWVCVVDGRLSKPYDAVGAPIFSPDSRHVAHAGKAGTAWSMFVDGKPGKSYANIIGPLFSPDSKHLTFAAQLPGPGTATPAHGNRTSPGPEATSAPDAKWCIVTDGVERGEYDGLKHVTISSDGQRLAFAARRGAEWFMVTDGTEEGPFAEVSDALFSPDGRRFAYCSLGEKGQRTLRVDGAEVAQVGMATPVTFSADSEHYAYVGGSQGAAFVAVDGVPGPSYDTCACPVFSPDGKVAYSAQRNGQHFIVAGGVEYAAGDAVSRPLFSPDSRLIAWFVRRGSTVTPVISVVGQPDSSTEGTPYDRVFVSGEGFDDAVGQPWFNEQGVLQFTAQCGTQLLSVQAAMAGTAG